MSEEEFKAFLRKLSHEVFIYLEITDYVTLNLSIIIETSTGVCSDGFECDLIEIDKNNKNEEKYRRWLQDIKNEKLK